ncbi:MAG: spore maturation protein [Terrimicrobiaceae bacterium]|nr:spore maturation protein [Terrimicrobiaceae bacterium]
MLNAIWLGLVVLAVVAGALTGRLPEVTKGGLDAASKAVTDIALPLAGVMALWLGIMRLAEKSGAVLTLARGLRPVLRRLFPDVPADHPAMGSMVMNLAANMLGLANAATPLGLRAMQDLEKLNPRPGTATNAMCTFLALNTSSVQLIPATAVALLAAQGSAQPTAIIGTALAATICSTAAALVAVKTLERLPVFALPAAPCEHACRPEGNGTEPGSSDSPAAPEAGPCGRVVLLLAALFFAAVFVMLAVFPFAFSGMAGWVSALLGQPATGSILPPGWLEKPLALRLIETLSLLAIPGFLVFLPLNAAVRKIPVYEEFVEGAKEGFQVAVRIIPYLVAILAAVGMFRAAGGIDVLSRLLQPLLAPIGFPSELLPLAFLRPLSGSGSLGLFAELVQTHGPDSLLARMAGTLLGSTETTFYVLAVYFGSVAIRRTRHAVAAGLIADLAGILAAVFICRLVFGG